MTTDSIGRMDLAKRIPKIKEGLAEIAKLELYQPDRLYTYINDLTIHPTTTPYCLTHGDLYARHLLIDKKKLTGIIDWGDCELGHPAVDLAIAFSFLPPASHDTFKAAYGPINAETWKFARIRALVSCTMVIRYSHDIGDKNLLREGLQGLKWIEGSLQ